MLALKASVVHLGIASLCLVSVSVNILQQESVDTA